MVGRRLGADAAGDGRDSFLELTGELSLEARSARATASGRPGDPLLALGGGRSTPEAQKSGRSPAAPPIRAPAANAVRLDVSVRGWRDYSAAAWPTAPVTASVPRRLFLERMFGGVQVRDDSQRQAVYLEQELPSALTRRCGDRSSSSRFGVATPTPAAAPSTLAWTSRRAAPGFRAAGPSASARRS